MGTHRQCRECGKTLATGATRFCRRCYMDKFGDTPLQAWRKRTGLSYRWLADQTGVSERTIKRLAAGHSGTSRIIKVIADVTLIPIEDLIRG